KTMNDPSHLKMNNDSYYVRSPAEMAEIFREVPDALHNTVAIAERCNVDLDPTGFHLPDVPIPGDHTPKSYLRHLTEQGLQRLYGDAFHSERVQQRIDHELDIIHNMGFDTYFLIVWDLCEFSKRQDIWWNVRGSAAGSIVAYGLGITNIDPLAYDLIFERFLNPDRVTMPDIDLDYPDDRRQEMIDYTMRKYGADKVAQIITFGTLGARAAIRDVGRALDIPLNEVDKVARLVPGGPGITLDYALSAVPDLRQLYEGVDYVRTVIDTAKEVEGVSRHASTHAAGVVITDKPLVEYTPLHRPTRGADEGLPVTQYTMDVIEDTGLLKVDFLGLSTLTVLRMAVDLIKARHGISYTPYTVPPAGRQAQESLAGGDVPIPLDDPQAFKLLASGNVLGIFQVESAGFRRVLSEMKPARFEHIIAVLALYRPGPMENIPLYIRRMHGDEAVTYDHPLLEPILRETYGIIVFQEQIIQIATQLAGYKAGEADLMRKAVGKKLKKALLAHRTKFVAGCVASGIEQEIAEKIFDDIEYFARYGFNKGHAADYAIITMQTAFLKAHYPVEFMTALLTVEKGNTEKVGQLIAEARRLGIEVLPPDVNHSGMDFTIEDEPAGEEGPAIRYGLCAIKNVGDGPVQATLEARGAVETGQGRARTWSGGQPFADLDDFVQRVDLRQVNRRALECLIKAGTLRAFGTRAQLLHVVDRMMDESQKVHGMVQQSTFFDMPAFAPTGLQATLPEDVPEFPRKEVLGWEKELVGAYISDHPLSRVWSDLENTITVLTGQIEATMAGQNVTVAGMVNDVRRIVTKKGRPMAFVLLEDIQGTVDVVVFPRVWEATSELWQPERVLVVRGKVNVREGDLSIIAESVTNEIMTVDTPGKVAAEPPRTIKDKQKHVHIFVPRTADIEQTIRRLGQVYNVLLEFPGEDRFSLYVEGGGNGDVQIQFPNDTTRHCVDLESRLRSLLGAGTIRVEKLNR
ncbi:MAG: DNA polymerase III subunit alpha, partial [Anaerolineae bacterium]